MRRVTTNSRTASRAGAKRGPGVTAWKKLPRLVSQLAELMTEDAEGAGGIAKASGDFEGGESLNEVGAEGFVLTLERVIGGEEEAGFGR